ncbi:MAG TPA: hypothetical protein VJA40_02125 [archaeon]|nr:hypothetical protein [archaeon]
MGYSVVIHPKILHLFTRLESRHREHEVREHLEKALSKLESGEFHGEHERKYQLLHFEKEFNVDNLWVMRIDGNWRLLYSIQGNTAVVVGVMDHKDYDDVFGYKTS